MLLGEDISKLNTPLLLPSLPLLPVQSDPLQVVLLGKFGVQNLHSPSWSHIKTFKMQIRINVELYFVAIECPLPPPPPLLSYCTSCLVLVLVLVL